MDAAASPKNETEFDKVYDLFLKIENAAFPASIKQRHSVIKYTKLPDIDFDSKVTWHEETFSLQPHSRRVITINKPKLSSTRSLKPEIAIISETRIPSVTRRKIVTIAEDDENDLHPKFSRDGRKPVTKTLCKAVGTELKEDKPLSHRKTSRLSPYSKSSKDTKLSAKNNLLNNHKESNSAKLNYTNKHLVTEKISGQKYVRSQTNKEKEGVTRNAKNLNTTSKINVNKYIGTSSETDKDIRLIKSKVCKNWGNNFVPKKMIEKQGLNKISPREHKTKVSYIQDIKDMNKAVTVIHVPLDETFKRREKAAEISESLLNAALDKVNKVDCSTEVEKIIFSKDISIGTEPLPTTINQVTEIDTEYETICKHVEKTNIHTELKETFDSLDIPNVTLIKDRSSTLPKESEINFCKKSLPTLQISTFEGNKIKNETDDSRYSKSTSYIISRATLTYTTKQKINFHVMGKNDNIPNELSTSPLTYPMSVVSLFKKEVNKKDLYENSEVKIDRNHDETKKYANSNNLKQFNCPYNFDNAKLVKPSDIISTIEGHNGLLQNEYISEQFQRELNFIDSFFESLQYLEHCSLAEKCLSDRKVESWINKSGFDLKKLEYGSLLSTFDKETHVDDTETMASKSLCLLNLLIRNEQRRAKNLLFVLKMREDALTDFTKSQILWLENKKKQDNTDISTLKKKQRGALLKLQHECGEMQRMRKALLTLSEKRKVALIKTKKNIELKLRNNIDVDQILSGKKKIKRTTVTDRSLAPIKCFDLSSSGCDDSTPSRAKSETPVPSPDVAAIIDTISSAEKSIQTGDSVIVTSTVDQSINTTDENFLVVDGGYLNILFHNLALPQIFSSGKQYEVNEEALKNIVFTANTNRNNINEGGDIQRFMDQIKNYEVDRSTSPSTARSLVEEFDHYYMGLVDEDTTPIDSEQTKPAYAPVICEVRDSVIHMVESGNNPGLRSKSETQIKDENLDKDKVSDNTVFPREEYDCEPSPTAVTGSEMVTASVAGPLPVPAGAAASPDTTIPDALSLMSQKSLTTSTSSDLSSSSCLTMSSIASPVHYEAEELRRQQLAIEREIKALEQQQCQLLVVREIPDKPPPPYTPPNETRTPKPPRMFLLDDATEQKVRRFISVSCKNTFDTSDQFEIFIKDFCQETLKNHKSERSDKPWHSCNLLPQKPSDGVEKIVTRTTSHIAEVLKGVTPTVVSGVGARRSDHIDDILFAEWRRCEPEWTTLHSDEAIVKNQLFESIFQRILTETVDEYKRTVLYDSDDRTMNI